MAESVVVVTRVDAQLGDNSYAAGAWSINVVRRSRYAHDTAYRPKAEDLPQDVREGLRRWLNGMEDEPSGDAGSTKL